MCTVLWSASEMLAVLPTSFHCRNIPAPYYKSLRLLFQLFHLSSKLHMYLVACLRIILQRQSRKKELWSGKSFRTITHSQLMCTVSFMLWWELSELSLREVPSLSQTRKKKNDETLRLFKIPHPNRSWWAGALSWSESEHRCSDFCTLKKKKKKEKRSRFVLQAISCHSAHTLHS